MYAMRIAYVALGSNLGNRAQNMRSAIRILGESNGILIDPEIDLASLYESSPVGVMGQGRYMNSVARIWTSLDPRRLLGILLSVESQLGRVRGERWGSRTLDLDLLLFDEEVIREEELLVPHPRMHERRFVLDPLAELAPDLIHPILQKSIAALHAKARAATPDSEIRRICGPEWVLVEAPA